MALAREQRTNGETRTGGECTVQIGHDGGDDVPVSTAVYEGLAAAEGVDVTDLDVRLYDYVDVDALDALFQGGSHANVDLEFAVGEHVVAVRNDGEVTVSDGE